jgi:subtilisin family serine protease
MIPVQPMHKGSGETRDELAGDRASYSVLFDTQQIPGDFASRVTALGGTVESALDSVGVAVVSGLSPDALASLAVDGGLRVAPNTASSFVAATEDIPAPEEEERVASVPSAPVDNPDSPAHASLYARQWYLRAVHADEAWDAGYLGSSDAVVAIFDTGIDYLHPELQGLVDLSRSKAFTTDDDATLQQLYPGRNPVTDLFWHGTAVASTVGSNAINLAGVNKHVTLLAIKVADRFGVGRPASNWAAVLYAVEQGADIINASGGMQIDRRLDPVTYEGYVRVLEYAWRKGVLVVGVMGNAGRNRDLDGDMVGMPCQGPHVICVSGTGPTSALSVNGPWENIDASWSLTNFGSMTAVAAPSGQGFAFTRIWRPCLTSPSPASPLACRQGAAPRLNQGLGTSFSGALVSGLAAQLVSRYGHRNPAMLTAKILESADDLGEHGWDPYYGRGRINVARALGVPHSKDHD